MNTQEFIPLDIFCRQHGVEVSFISSLQEFGLIEITRVDETRYIPAAQLQDIEKLVRLHEELAINLEGIDVVTQLLQRMQAMQQEIIYLRNRLGLYE